MLRAATLNPTSRKFFNSIQTFESSTCKHVLSFSRDITRSRPDPVLLPQLVDLRLSGADPAEMVRFMVLVSTSSPLHDVVIHFQFVYGTFPTLVSAVG